MKTRRLGQTDLNVSSISLGCVTFDREVSPETSFAIMDYALERGIKLFDTAEAYAEGRSEAVVGAWLRKRRTRDRIVLATKAAPPLGNRLIGAAEASLRRLESDVIDLYQLHAWDENAPLDETLQALDMLVREGKVRYVGCSNFFAWQVCRALARAEANGWPRMVSVQPIYNLAVRDIETELLPYCADEGLGVITYSPLGAGFLTGKYHSVGVSPKGSRFDIKPAHWNIYQGATSMRRMEGLRALADETGNSMVKLALAWVFGRPEVTSVLIGARMVEHIDQAFAADRIVLEPTLRQALDEL